MTKLGKTVKTLQKMKERGYEISPYISAHNQFTALMFDPTSDPPCIFEQLLKDVDEGVRNEFVVFRQSEYTPPTELAFMQDKQLLAAAFMDYADGDMTTEEIEQFMIAIGIMTIA